MSDEEMEKESFSNEEKKTESKKEMKSLQYVDNF